MFFFFSFLALQHYFLLSFVENSWSKFLNLFICCCCPLDKETMNCEADGQAKQNNHPVVSEGSSSEDCQVLGKRKRKLTGAWWLSCPQSAEETDSNQQPKQKQSKRKPKEPSAAVCSPTKAKKEKVSKKTNQKKLQVSPDQQTSEAERRETKRRNKGNKRGDALDKVKATNEEFITAAPEQTEEQEQQEVPDQDPDQEESNPLMFTQRDLSVNTGKIKVEVPVLQSIPPKLLL